MEALITELTMTIGSQCSQSSIAAYHNMKTTSTRTTRSTMRLWKLPVFAWSGIGLVLTGCCMYDSKWTPSVALAWLPRVRIVNPADRLHVRFFNKIGFQHLMSDNREMHVQQQQQQQLVQEDDVVAALESITTDEGKSAPALVRYQVTTEAELEEYFADTARRFRRSRSKDNTKVTGTTVSNSNNQKNDNVDDIDYTALLRALSVAGDTQVIGSPDHPEYTHPVVQLLYDRKRRREHRLRIQLEQQLEQQDTNVDDDIEDDDDNDDNDDCRIALAIEGGGMRGCISAGMICALHHLNLTDSLDVVYGSSAGTIIGAYLITGQFPWFGPEVYYDRLTTAGRQFIDTGRLLRAIGFGLLDPRLLKDVLMRPEHGKPVLNLPFLLQTTVQHTKPLDWATFEQKQATLPLKIMASGLKSEKAIVLDYGTGAFRNLQELTDCMHASCLLPGIAGPVMNLDRRVLQEQNISGSPKMILANHLEGDHYEPLADALLFEPIPYRSAVASDNVTHVIAIRSRPDGTDVTGKGSVFERLIFRRFFKRKNRLPRMYRYVRQQMHKKLYAHDILRLNAAAYDPRPYYRDGARIRQEQRPMIMTVALPPGSTEVTRLETRRSAIFDGMRRGFARAYDCLVEDPAERGKGEQVALQYFPDEILDYDPLIIEQQLQEQQEQQQGSSTSSSDLDPMRESAFSVYMRTNNIAPKAWSSSSITTGPPPAAVRNTNGREETTSQGIQQQVHKTSSNTTTMATHVR